MLKLLAHEDGEPWTEEHQHAYNWYLYVRGAGEALLNAQLRAEIDGFVCREVDGRLQIRIFRHGRNRLRWVKAEVIEGCKGMDAQFKAAVGVQMLVEDLIAEMPSTPTG